MALAVLGSSATFLVRKSAITGTATHPKKEIDRKARPCSRGESSVTNKSDYRSHNEGEADVGRGSIPPYMEHGRGEVTLCGCHHTVQDDSSLRVQ